MTVIKGSVNSVAWSFDGEIIASGSDDRTIKLWSKDGKKLTTFESDHSTVINNLAWSPAEEIIAFVGNDRSIKLWRKDGKQVITLEGHQDLVTSVTWESQWIYSRFWK